MEKEELALFLDTSDKKGLEMDYLIFLVLAYTGMRVDEIVSLQWSDIDFRKSSIRIVKTYYNPRNNTMQFELGTPKTMGSVPTIVVEDIVIHIPPCLQKQESYWKTLWKDWVTRKTILQGTLIATLLKK
ncbi:Phage integrase family protein [Paenibacillus sp. PDC88]|nr:tyrosine-type recombinase/integrase [Paenibacillus sp. PDC88]SDX30630.1 Phage integrase family protein [Paenibacillus sp. PDC88]